MQKFFVGSKVFESLCTSDNGRNKAILYKALLYFNLPWDEVIKKKLKPNLAFSVEVLRNHNSKAKDLKDLIEILEGGAEDLNIDKTTGDAHRSPNIILMQVSVPNGDTQIIGGYASH